MSKGDTVSKEYLLAEIDDLADEFSEVDENRLHSERWCGIMDARGVIMNAPLVIDRPQGKWIMSDIQNKADNDNGNYQYICSECGHGDTHAKAQEVPYCWWCGSRMKGADDEVL